MSRTWRAPGRLRAARRRIVRRGRALGKPRHRRMNRVHDARRRCGYFATRSKLEARAVARVEPGVQCRRLATLGLIELEFAPIGRLRFDSWNGEDSCDEVVFFGVEDLNDVTVRGRIEKFHNIRPSREDRILNLDRLINGNIRFLIPFICLHGGGEHAAHQAQSQGSERCKVVFHVSFLL